MERNVSVQKIKRKKDIKHTIKMLDMLKIILNMLDFIIANIGKDWQSM